MPRSKYIKNCRLCSSLNLKSFIDFGKLPLGNNLQKNFTLALNTSNFPLHMLRCLNCNHFQLNFSVSPNLLYATNYTYLSSIGSSFVDHIKKYALWVEKKCFANKKKFIFEIGSNDGTCLNEFKKLGHKVCGVDPAKLPSEIANKKGIETINTFFDKKCVKQVIKNFGKPDVITSQNCLAHIDKIEEAFQNAYDLLKDNGYFVFEVGYFGFVLKDNLFDTIYHEHLDYHHANPITQFLKKIGFSILSITLNKTQGGSIRILSKKLTKCRINKQVNNFLNKEKQSYLYNNEFLNLWPKIIKQKMSKLNQSLIEYKNDGYKIVGYGAPTKATLLLDFLNLKMLDLYFVVDDNKLKINKFLPKPAISVKPVKNLIKMKNLVIVILAWNFSKDIVAKLKKLNLNGIVVIPLPELIIKKI